MGGYGTYLTRMSPIPVSAAWVRGGVESNVRDVEDAVPYGQLRNVTGSITPAHECNDVRGKRGMRPGNVGLTGRANKPHPRWATSRVNPSAAAKRKCGRR